MHVRTVRVITLAFTLSRRYAASTVSFKYFFACTSSRRQLQRDDRDCASSSRRIRCRPLPRHHSQSKDATVFEETSDDASDVNRLRQSRLTRADHTRTYDQIDLHASLGRFVKRFDDVQIGQTIDLGHMCAGRPQCMFGFTLYQTHHAHRRFNGATIKRLYSFWIEKPVRKLNRSVASSPITESLVSKPRSVYSLDVVGL